MPNLRRTLMGAAGAESYTPGTPDATMYICGTASDGALGNDTETPNLSSMTQLGVKDNWKSIVTGSRCVLGIKSGGTMWAWGNNYDGNLGDGTTVDKSSPIQIGLLSDWSHVASQAQSFFLAIKNDGTLWSWGQNNKGQLGHGDTVYRSSPTQVGSLTDWSIACAGTNTSHFIKTDGTLWGVGYNGNRGVLGDNTQVNKSSPVQIGALTTWARVNNCTYGGHAVKTDGTLWGWGRNFYGELGAGTYRTIYSSPIQVGALTDWFYCANTGFRQRVAVKTDGTLWSWGGSVNRYSPSNSSVKTSSPVQVGALTTWSDVWGRNNSDGGGAIKTDGTLWGWGSNGQGRIGDGTTIQRSSPVQNGASTSWTNPDVSIGGANTVAIVID